MRRSLLSTRTRSPRRLAAVGMALALLLALVPSASPAGAAGLNLQVQMGQRFLGSASPAKALPIPLSTKIGPIRGLAVAGISATTFEPIKVAGITVFSSGEVKELVLETIDGLSDNTVLSFRVDALEHPKPQEFTIGGNCIGADGATTAVCVATVVFKPNTPGLREDPINAQITITQGMSEIEDSLRVALQNQGVVGTLVNIVYPLIRSYVQTELTDGIEGAMLAPIATAKGTGVAGPFTDPGLFVRRQYGDFAAGTPSQAQVTTWVKNFENGVSPITLIDNLRRADAWDGRVGPITRLYSAYFLRAPDTSGLRFWVARSRAGTRLYAISSNFAASSEFNRRYGSLSNADFVKLIYKNVLGRNPDSGGLTYWTNQLNKGNTRGRVMVGFSESSEYKRKQGPTVAVTHVWFGMLRRAPSAAEIAGFGGRLASGTPTTTIITEVLASTEYRSVVLGGAA